jgi:transcriptional regulator with XRE-family HTH domain
MANREIPDELLVQMRRDRELIKQELPDLMERDERMKEAASEDTLCGHLRRAVHQSHRPLREIARETGIATTVLCDFLEGERTLRSDVLDRLAQAVGVTISITLG